MLASMSSRELSEWIAFYSIDPFDDGRGDLQAGVIAATFANIHRGKNQKPFSALDFMPYAEEERKAKSRQEFLNTMRMLEERQNGR